MNHKPIYNYEHFFNASTDLLALLDNGGYLKRVNNVFQEIFGWTKNELVDRAIWRFAHPEDQKHVRNAFRNLAKGHPIIFTESKFVDPNGDTFAIRWSAYPDSGANYIYLVARMTEEEAIKDFSFKLALESSPTSIFIVQEDGKISYANKLGTKTFQYTENELLDLDIEMLLPGNLRNAHAKNRHTFNKNPVPRPMGTKRLDLIAQRKDGTTFPVDVGLSPVRTIHGTVVLCSLIDISLRVKQEETFQKMIASLKAEIAKLDKLASIDELTEIYNRRAFLKQAELQLYISHANSSPLSLAILDIDNFKNYNDNFGHIEGDKTLSTIGKLLRTETRHQDVSARYGGEEFAILMPATEKEDACSLATRLRKSIENFEWPHRKITTSIGLATYHPRLSSIPTIEFITQFIMLADEALYHSKEQGKNRITHIDSLQPDHIFSVNSND